MPNWAKYSKKYNPEWEKDPLFSNWLQKTPDSLINEGKKEAYCKLCKVALRPQRNDLHRHKDTMGHQQHEKALPSKTQPQLEKFGFDSNAPKKTIEKVTQ